MERYNIGRLRKVMVVLFFCLTAFYISRGLISIVASGFGVGNVIRAFFPGILCMVGLMVFARPDLFPLGFRSRKIGLKEGLLIFVISTLIALAFLVAHIEHLPYLFVVLISLIGLLKAMHLTATRDDIWGIVAFLLTVPFLEYVQENVLLLEPIYGNFITLPHVSILLVIGIAFLRMPKNGTHRLIRTSLDMYILAFILILFLSSITSPDRSESFKILFQIIIVIPIFFVIGSRIHSGKDLILLLATLILSALLIDFIGNYTVFRHLGSSFLTLVEMRAGLEISTKGFLGLAAPIPIAISMAIINSKYRIKWIYYALAAVVFVLVILISQTRSLLVPLVISAPIILLYRRGKRWLLLVGLIAVILPMFASNITPIFFERYKDLMSLQGWERALAMRLDGWRAALAMIRDYPFTGVGLGMWEEFIHLYGNPYRWVIEGQRTYIYITSAHNNYLHYGAEAGVIALLLSFLIILKVQLATFSVMKRVKDDCMHTIAVGLAWSCLLILPVGISYSTRGFISGSLSFWSLMAIIMAMKRVAFEETPVIESKTLC